MSSSLGNTGRHGEYKRPFKLTLMFRKIMTVGEEWTGKDKS